MKLIKSIFGCTAAFALLACSTGQALAGGGGVIDNVLFVPVNVKIAVTFTISGKPKKITLTNKIIGDILQLEKGTTLAISTDTGDLWALNNNGGSEDLTADGVFTVSNNLTGSTQNGSVKTDTGTMELDFYDQPVLGDKGASETNSANWFEVTGNYTLVQKQGTTNTQGMFKISAAYSATVSGTGFFGEVSNSEVPMAGTVSAKGGGTLQGP